MTKLHVSCMNILDDLVKNIPEGVKDRTPLKHLTLEECNICSSGLEALLSLPTALESLYLGENCHNSRHFSNPIPVNANHLFLANPAEVLKALEQQKHSLKSLTYLTPAYYPTRLVQNSISTSGSDGGLSKFLSLEEVTLVGYCPTFERCVVSMRSPPNLKRLALRAERPWFNHRILLTDDDSRPISNIPFLRAPSASLPKSLKQLDVTYNDLRGVSIEEFVRLGGHVSLFQEIHKAASKAGVALRIFATQSESDLRYYPPFLYGEKEPPDVLISDGEDSS